MKLKYLKNMTNKLETIITPEEEWTNFKQEIEDLVAKTEGYVIEKIGIENRWGKWWGREIVKFGNKVKKMFLIMENM